MNHEDALSGQKVEEEAEAREMQQEVEEETENVSEGMSMETLLEEGELTLDLPRRGEVRTGVVARVTDSEVLVSIGAKSEGLISSRELEQLSDEQRQALKVGEEITVYVISPHSKQGTLLLSLTRALEEDDWDRAEKLMRKKELFEGEISGFNKGGLIVAFGRLRGFVPASQVGVSRRMAYSGDTPEDRWGGMVGEPIATRVIEVDRQRRRLILSERAASQEARETLKERLLEELEEGEVRTGRVTSLADFGAFVNINGADGLVHLSELSWDRVNHPSEVLEVGQEVNVKVISVDHERKRIGLSLRRLQDDPWEDRIGDYREGQLVEGEITRLTKFGAFARIAEDLEGLVHISELAEQRIEHPKEVVSEGDRLTLRIIKLDTDRRRIGLSLRKVDSLKYSDLDWEMALAESEEESGKETEQDQAEEAPPVEDQSDAEPSAEMPEEAEEAQGEEAPPVEDQNDAEPSAEMPEEAEETQAEEADEAKAEGEDAPKEASSVEDQSDAEPSAEMPAEAEEAQAEEIEEAKAEGENAPEEAPTPEPQDTAEETGSDPDEPDEEQASDA